MRFGLRFRVGSLLMAAFSVLSAVLVIVLGLKVVGAVPETFAAGRLVTLAEADRTVFGTMQTMRISRGDTLVDRRSAYRMSGERAKLIS